MPYLASFFLPTNEANRNFDNEKASYLTGLAIWQGSMDSNHETLLWRQCAHPLGTSL